MGHAAGTGVAAPCKPHASSGPAWLSGFGLYGMSGDNCMAVGQFSCNGQFRLLTTGLTL